MPIMIPPSGADVLPAPDSDFGLFATQFAGAWVPATFNVVLPAAAGLVTDAGAFNTALLIATDPTTRSSVTIATKDTLRGSLSLTLRSAIRAAQAAYLAGTATEAALNNIGVRANSLVRSPIGAPTFAPMIASDGATPGNVRFRVTQVDQTTGVAVTTRGFAYGITGVLVQRKVGAGDFLNRMSIKRTSFVDSSSDVAMGTVLAYRMRYQTARGLYSPWSSVVNSVAM